MKFILDGEWAGGEQSKAFSSGVAMAMNFGAISSGNVSEGSNRGLLTQSLP
jgi:hypothetical protein